ncbi:tetratricopeptide repeat protein [Pseudoxanthomonas mexicana]|uniref:tetratricopeptide repeat protein n=1 Tax=Pseudoxanthomonas mexicana TaxID=128785 RepID=UPI00398AE47A
MMATQGTGIGVRAAWGLALMAALAACATPSKKKLPDFAALMEQADAAVGNGRVDEALQLLESAGKADPVRKDAWLRAARLQFEAGNYARAIVAAEEALQRDPGDQSADGIITVAGFRIASSSLQRLKANGALVSDSARKEAEVLAATLKDTLGDDILAPPPATPRRRAATPRPLSPSTPAQPARPVAAPAPSGDPFQKIGGNR